MKTITYITGNPRKIENAQKILKEYGINVVQEAMETPEIQADDPNDVARYSAKYASEKINKPVIKMDVGFHIKALNGFPGPYIKQVNNWFEPKQILHLLENQDNRECFFKDVICFASKEGESRCFIQETKGNIAKEVTGENGWGMDKIFIPDGFNKTLASMTNEERSQVWGKKHWEELADYLKSNL
jgi:non-canonical purine NTP pyrophosphatase (RdgB/HAM1 family)